MGVECYAVASRNLEKADAFAKEYGFKKAYGSYEKLASDSAVDLIYIATPHSHHHEFAKLCIEHGRNILVEKAFTANAKLASEVIALAHDKGVFLCEAMWTRFLPALEKIRHWIRDGRIGNVETVEADFSMKLSDRERMHNPSLASGALLDIGIYSLTFADLFLGERKTSDGNFVRNEITSMDCKCIKFETGVDAHYRTTQGLGFEWGTLVCYSEGCAAKYCVCVKWLRLHKAIWRYFPPEGFSFHYRKPLAGRRTRDIFQDPSYT